MHDLHCLESIAPRPAGWLVGPPRAARRGRTAQVPDPDQVVRWLTILLDDPKLHADVLVTTVDARVVLDGSRMSGRQLDWIKLSLLRPAAVEAIFNSLTSPFRLKLLDYRQV